MSAGDRAALVSAMLALREVARLAWDGKTRTAYARASNAARRAEAALGVEDGCPGCGGAVEVVTFGRPRRYCETCHPPRTRPGR